MDSHDLFTRHSEHAERIVGAQILLGGEREFRQVLELAEIIRMHAGRAGARVPGQRPHPGLAHGVLRHQQQRRGPVVQR